MALSLVLTVSCTEDEADIEPLTSESIQLSGPVLLDQELEETAKMLAVLLTKIRLLLNFSLMLRRIMMVRFMPPLKSYLMKMKSTTVEVMVLSRADFVLSKSVQMEEVKALLSLKNLRKN